MNWRAIIAIVRKDILVIRHTKGVLIPMIVVPLIITILLPALFAILPQLAEGAGVLDSMTDINSLLERFPAEFRATLAPYDPVERAVVMLAVYYFAPMYLILPIMVSSVVAADSLAGEKERKTLEALLYTPTSDRDLFVAKLLSAWLPAVAVAWAGFLAYAVILNTVAWPVFERIFFPNLMWWILALWVAPAIAGIGLGFTVLISARVSTFQEAYQLGGIVVIPIVALMISQSSGALYLGNRFVFLLGCGAWLIDFALLWFGARTLRRNELMLQL